MLTFQSKKMILILPWTGRKIYTDPGSEQLGSVLVLGDEVVQVGPVQSLERNKIIRLNTWTETRNGPGSEQIRRLNSLLDKYHANCTTN